MNIQTAADTLVTKTATFATYSGSAGAIFGGINANWVAAIGGILIGLAGLAVNVYYKHQHFMLAKKNAGLIGHD